MNLCNDFQQVQISSTAGAGAKVTLTTGVAGHVPCLNKLDVGSTAKTVAKIRSDTTVLDEIALGASESVNWPFEPLVEGSLRGLVGEGLTIATTAATLYGSAIVSWTTMPAT